MFQPKLQVAFPARQRRRERSRRASLAVAACAFSYLSCKGSASISAFVILLIHLDACCSAILFAKVFAAALASGTAGRLSQVAAEACSWLPFWLG
jgi:hypothetical protein